MQATKLSISTKSPPGTIFVEAIESSMWNKRGAFLLAAACVFLCGCGSSIDGVQLTGSVTFDGQPVETGKITFEPQQGGTMTIATITDGTYQLPSERPATPGKYLVRITADRSTGRMIGADSRSQEDQPAEEIVQYLPEKYNLRSQLFIEVTEDQVKHDFTLTSN